MSLDFIAAVPYAFKVDVKMTVYWIAAGVLTLAMTSFVSLRHSIVTMVSAGVLSASLSPFLPMPTRMHPLLEDTVFPTWMRIPLLAGTLPL